MGNQSKMAVVNAILTLIKLGIGGPKYVFLRIDKNCGKWYTVYRSMEQFARDRAPGVLLRVSRWVNDESYRLSFTVVVRFAEEWVMRRNAIIVCFTSLPPGGLYCKQIRFVWKA